MKICLAQTEPARGEIAANIADHLHLLNKAVSGGSDCIFFPELSLTGYEPALAAEMALLRSEKRLDVFQNYSDTNKIIIGVGAPVQIDSGVGIGMFLFEPDQARKIYFKKYLHSDEVPFFKSEVDFSGILNVNPQIALAICYEISVEEHVEHTLHTNPKIYLASVAKFTNGLEKAENRLKTIARKYRLTCMMVNSVGQADGAVCGGKSGVWNREGKLICQMDAERPGILIFDTTDGTSTIRYNAEKYNGSF